jgi:hypothetical protein
MRKTIRNFSFAAIAMAVLCAGTLSARQLKMDAQSVGACGTTCSATVHCSGLCTCWIDSGASTGFCAKEPPAAKPKTK